MTKVTKSELVLALFTSDTQLTIDQILDALPDHDSRLVGDAVEALARRGQLVCYTVHVSATNPPRWQLANPIEQEEATVMVINGSAPVGGDPESEEEWTYYVSDTVAVTRIETDYTGGFVPVHVRTTYLVEPIGPSPDRVRAASKSQFIDEIGPIDGAAMLPVFKLPSQVQPFFK